MKKVLSVLVLVLASITLVSAQDVFKKGDMVLNVGIGLGNTLHTGSGYSTVIPPISGSFEYCIKDNLFDSKSSLGVGAYLGYTSSEYKYNYTGIGKFKYKYSDVVLGVRGALHYQFIPKLDTYAGISLGYDIVSGSSSGSHNIAYSASSSAVYFGGFLGARYYFKNNLAVMAELGYDVSVFNIGIAYKF